MRTIAHNSEVSGEAVDEELKAVMRALHPRWSDEVLEQHIQALHSPEWAEAYRDIFREPKAKMTSLET